MSVGTGALKIGDGAGLHHLGVVAERARVKLAGRPKRMAARWRQRRSWQDWRAGAGGGWHGRGIDLTVAGHLQNWNDN